MLLLSDTMAKHAQFNLYKFHDRGCSCVCFDATEIEGRTHLLIVADLNQMFDKKLPAVCRRRRSKLFIISCSKEPLG